MALITNSKNITGVNAYGRTISAIYNGATLLWEAVKSCFGCGMWQRSKPWLYKEGWRLKK